MVKPDAFRLLAGDAELAEHVFNTKNKHHFFCKHCGVRSFGRGNSPDFGGIVYGVNVTCLDDVNIDELVNAPITDVDGRNDNWHSAPAETRRL